MLSNDFKIIADCDLPVGLETDPGNGSSKGPVRPHIDGGPTGGAGEPLQLICPSTSVPFTTVAGAGPEDIRNAVESAARNWALWRGTSFSERGKCLRQLASLAYEQRHSIAHVIAREQGKPYLEALSLEVLPALDHLRFIIHQVENFQVGLAVDPRHPFYTHKQAHYMYDPIGVVALVTPSPMPFAVPMVQVAAALAMGNAVVLKPSEYTPLSGLRVGELCTKAGVPAGVVNVVPAVAKHTAHLVMHAKVDKVFVTGSLEAGQSILATAGCSVRPIVLSLGGNHPSIVASDADLERAARGIAWGALANCGQNCGSVERVFVVDRVASEFMKALRAEVDRITVGCSLEPGVDVGPLHSREQRAAVHRRVSEAAAGGGRIICGGRIPDGPGYFYPPTIMLDPPLDSRLMRQETQGPIIPVTVTDGLERAILLANDTEYKLTASGWTRSPDTADRLMVGLEFGVVTINDVLYSYGEPAATWSGHGKSGTGQAHGRPGLREMCRQRFVSFDGSGAEAPLFAFPYDEQGAQVAETALDYLNHRSWFLKTCTLLRLIRQRRFRRRTPLRGLLAATRRHV